MSLESSMRFFLQKVHLDETRLKEMQSQGSSGAAVFEVLGEKKSSICVARFLPLFYSLFLTCNSSAAAPCGT